MGDEPIIELRGVGAHRGGFQILREVSFSLAEGATTVFMGGAGSGKSTLLKAAAGIVVPDEGAVFFRGKDLSRMSRAEELEFHRRSGFVFQDAALWANQSLYDNLALPLRLHEHGLSAAEVGRAVARVAELVGYSEELKARPSELSTGERRLIGLARALVLDPELLFMDEPAAYLDETSAERVFEIIASLGARRRSVAIVSGSSEIAHRFADSLGVLKAGRLLAFGSYAEAVRWDDPAIRVVTGRLRARKGPVQGDAALSAWADALAGSLGEEAPPAPARPPDRAAGERSEAEAPPGPADSGGSDQGGPAADIDEEGR